MCHIDSVVSLGVESNNQALIKVVMKCFAPVFWCHFEYRIVLYYLVYIDIGLHNYNQDKMRGKIE